MSARSKLNRFHLAGDFAVAAIAGLITASWFAFSVVLVALISLDLQSRRIRVRRRRRATSERGEEA